MPYEYSARLWGWMESIDTHRHHQKCASETDGSIMNGAVTIEIGTYLMTADSNDAPGGVMQEHTTLDRWEE